MSVAIVVDGGVSLLGDGASAPVHLVAMQLGPDGSAATAAPSPGAFAEVITGADQGDGVLVVTVASGLSASYQAAHTACSLLDSDRCRLLDSQSATAGEGLVVAAAARAAASGADLEAVERCGRRAAKAVRLAAQIASLDRLARGGRLPPGAAGLARRTGLRPIFELRGGEIRPQVPAFSLAGAERRIVALFERTRPAAGRLHLAALHAGEPESAERLVAAVRALVEPATLARCELSAVMLAHTGPGVSGLSWWWEEA